MLINNANLDTVFKGFKAVYDASFDGTEAHYSKVAMTVLSSTFEEEYGWLGQFPALREWIGEREIHQLQAHGFKILNRKFENTVTVKRDDLADDRVGIYKPMFTEMGRVVKQHPDTLVFPLLRAGFDQLCYDGLPFFSSAHSYRSADGEMLALSNYQDGAEPPWFMLDLSRAVKPLIWQERERYAFEAVDDPTNNAYVFLRDEFLFGTRARVNVGLGLWQLALGSKAALNVGNFEAARVAMQGFRGDKGHLLGVNPTHLVVPPSLEKAAREMLKANLANGESNIWHNAVELIITPYIA